MMRLVLLLLVALVGIWAWRSARGDKAQDQVKREQPPALQEMASCALCGVHFPQAEGLSGKSGIYCSAEHRTQAEGRT